MSRQVQVKAGEGKLAVEASLTITAGGCVLQLYGGTHEHVGSVTLSTPRPSRLDPGTTSVTSSVINLPSHCEELVGRKAAEMTAIAMKLPVVCVAGIHIDAASDEEIAQMTANSQEAVRLLLDKI